jgi:hypothetical protein
MTPVSISDLVLGLLPILVLLLSGLGSVIYLVLQKRLDARFAGELEKTKHELQLELKRMSVLFEHQKDSFRKVLAAMHRAIEAIEHNVQGDGGDWLPISAKHLDTFQRLASEECLFMDGGTDRALELFSTIMWDAVQDGLFDHFPDSSDVRRAHTQMKLIAARVAEHFRSRVGLNPDKSDALLDVELLAACRLINTHYFPKFNMPTKTLLKFRDGESAEEMVLTARKNVAVLKSELQVLKNAAQFRDDGASFYYDVIARVDRYMDILEASKL